MMKNNRGVALASLVIAVLVMITITGTIVYTSLDTMKLRKLDDMYNDIRLLNQKVTDYYIENDELPVLENIKIDITDINNVIKDEEGNKNNENDSETYYIIDLEKLNGVNLKLGKDYSYYKENIEFNEEKKDVYIINKDTQTIYYLKGITIEGKTRYTLEDEFSQVELPVFVEDIYIYEYHDDNTATLIGVKEEVSELLGNVVFPSITINSENGNKYTVTGINMRIASGEGYEIEIGTLAIPNTVTDVDINLFSCNINDLFISSSVTNIKLSITECFIQAINVDEGNPNYISIDGVLFNKDGSRLIKYPCGKIENTYNIPDSVTEISEWSFYYSLDLENISIPIKVETIGEGAFADSGLEEIVILSSVTDIGNDALYPYFKDLTIYGYSGSTAEEYVHNYNDANENDITFVILDSGVFTYSYNEQDKTATLTGVKEGNVLEGDVTLPSATVYNDKVFNVTSIGDWGFSECTNLTSIRIPEGFTKIGYSAFNGCSSLTSVTIPSTVTSIGEFVFNECSSLNEINVDEGNTNYASNDGVLFDKDKTRIIKYPEGKVDTLYKIPESVTSIGERAFYKCSSLTSVTIPSNVTKIEQHAFAGCSKLVEVKIEGGHIHTDACLHEHREELGCYEWLTCEKCNGEGTVECGAKIECNGIIYHDCSAEHHRMEACPNFDTDYSLFCDSDQLGYCTEIIICPDCEGDGGFYDNFPNCEKEYDCVQTEIQSQLSEIGNNAFEECSSLTRITIPSTVTIIGERAFYGCENLTIYGYADSYAETYASDNNINFSVISE